MGKFKGPSGASGKGAGADDDKTKAELLDELRALRDRVGRLEKERRGGDAAHSRIARRMERFDTAMRQAEGLEQMLYDVLDLALEVFACDRAWLLYPCSQEADSLRVPMERAAPDFPGAFALDENLPMTREMRTTIETALAVDAPVRFGPDAGRPMPQQIADRFSVRSQMVLAVHPKRDRPWLFGLHHCRGDRSFSDEEKILFTSLGSRMGDALTGFLSLRDLRRSEQRYKLLTDAIDDVFRLTEPGDPERLVYVSPAFERVWEAAPERLYRKPRLWMENLHEDDRERVERTYFGFLRDKTPYDVEYRLVFPDGRVRWIHDRGFPVRGAPGELELVAGIARDVTEGKLAEAELVRAKEFSEKLIQTANVVFLALDDEGRVVQLNEATERITGYPREELMGRNWFETVVPRDRRPKE